MIELVGMIAVPVLLWALCGIYILQPQQAALIKRWGKPIKLVEDSGPHWRPIGIHSVTKVSYAIQEFTFEERILTKQEVTVAAPAVGGAPVVAPPVQPEAHAEGEAAPVQTVPVATVPTPANVTRTTALAGVDVKGVVQYSRLPGFENVCKSLFRLSKPEAMIKQRFQNALRGTMNAMTMWDALTDKDRAAEIVQDDLTHVTEQFGWTIDKISVTDARPDKEIEEQNNKLMGSIATMQRLANEGEGEKQKSIRIAQGRAEAMIENGRGIRGEREQVGQGWEALFDRLARLGGPAQVMKTVLFQNHLDVFREVARSPNAKVIMFDKSIGASDAMLAQLEQSLVTSGEAVRPAVGGAQSGDGADAPATETAQS